MRVPERQAELDAFTRKYLMPPKVEENGHTERAKSAIVTDFSDE
jgi:hypothetical protein